MRPHFLATAEGSLPITALLYGFEISDPLVLDAKNDWTLEGDVYPEFFQIIRCYDVVFWCFSSLSGDFSEYLWYVLITGIC